VKLQVVKLCVVKLYNVRCEVRSYEAGKAACSNVTFRPLTTLQLHPLTFSPLFPSTNSSWYDFPVYSDMATISELFETYRQRGAEILKEEHRDRNGCLVELENQMVDASGLGETDRMLLRAKMQEYRRQKINDYEAGAENPKISTPESGPRSGEYNA